MRTNWIRCTLLAVAAVLVVIVAGVASVIAFDSPKPLPRLAADDPWTSTTARSARPG